MLTVKSKSNFSFTRLGSYLESKKWQHYITAITSKPIAESAKDKIQKGQLRPLESSTLKLRQHRGVGSTKPLIETGALYDSIKATRGGVQMLEYGTFHNKRGFKPKYIPIISKGKERRILNKGGVRVPAREFLSVHLKDQPEVENKIARKFNQIIKGKRVAGFIGTP